MQISAACGILRWYVPLAVGLGTSLPQQWRELALVHQPRWALWQHGHDCQWKHHRGILAVEFYWPAERVLKISGMDPVKSISLLYYSLWLIYEYSCIILVLSVLLICVILSACWLSWIIVLSLAPRCFLWLSQIRACVHAVRCGAYLTHVLQCFERQQLLDTGAFGF